MHQFSRYESDALQEIVRLIKGQKMWSEYVDTLWKEQFEKAQKLPYVELTNAQLGAWRVSDDPNFDTIRHSVIRCDPQQGDIPVCTCSSFKSTLVPCAGICAVFSRISDHLFQTQNLHPRWQLANHPLYPDALRKLKLIPVQKSHRQADEGPSSSSISPQAELNIASYNSIVYPKKSDVRYSKLNQLFKKIESAAISDPHLYRILTLNLKSFASAIHDAAGDARFLLPGSDASSLLALPTSSPSTTLMKLPIEPPRKRGQGSSDINQYVSFVIFQCDLTHQLQTYRSGLKKRSRIIATKKKSCSHCRMLGVVPLDNHRANSSRCPNPASTLG